MFLYVYKDILLNILQILKVLMLEWVARIDVKSQILKIINAEKLRVSLLGLTMVSQPVSNIKVETDK